MRYGQSTYSYTAISPQGLRKKGSMRGPSREAVVAALREDGWSPIEVKEGGDRGLNMDLTAMLTGGEPVVALTVAESSELFRQMGELLAAGVSLSSVLESIAEEASPKVRGICEVLDEQISAGVPLSEALGAFPAAFDDVTRSYIAAGESAGTLVESVRLLADNLDKRFRLKMKIKGVTAYPKFVSMAIFGIVVIMIWRMVPMYSSMYADFGAELPAPTRALLTLSDNIMPLRIVSTLPYPFFMADDVEWSFLGLLGRLASILALLIGSEAMRNRSGKTSKLSGSVARWGMVVFLGMFTAGYEVNVRSAVVWSVVLGVVLGLRYVMNIDTKDIKAARRVDLVRFRMPVMGRLTQLTALYQWSSTLSGSLSSGVPMVKSLELSGRASGSVWHRAAAARMQEDVSSGIPLSESMQDLKGLYPGSVRSMVATGEDSGSLPTMLLNASRTVESEIDMIIAGLAAKVEVVLLVAMGVVVGGILVALYMPILSLAGNMGGM